VKQVILNHKNICRFNRVINCLGCLYDYGMGLCNRNWGR